MSHYIFTISNSQFRILKVRLILFVSETAINVVLAIDVVLPINVVTIIETFFLVWAIVTFVLYSLYVGSDVVLSSFSSSILYV
jgi:hypothetical protein